MIRDSQPLSILVIEDNLGDFVLIDDYLLEKFDSIRVFHSESFESAVLKFRSIKNVDVVLLDLGLPDFEGKKLVEKIQEYSADTPIIILTGYQDISLARDLLAHGVADFLIKDEINPEIIYKSIVYSLERKSYLTQLEKTKKLYQNLFDFSPQPMWIYDTYSLSFLTVNNAAIEKYGYTLEEFKSMTLRDIRPKDQIKYLENAVKKDMIGRGGNYAGAFIHTDKSGRNIIVEIYSSDVEYEGKTVRLVLANDITEKQEHVNTIEAQNLKLKSIAWTQSHLVRAPLSRLLGVINLLEIESTNSEDLSFLLEQIKLSGNELDEIIREIVSDT